jgi:hypothetical protein
MPVVSDRIELTIDAAFEAASPCGGVSPAA